MLRSLIIFIALGAILTAQGEESVVAGKTFKIVLHAKNDDVAAVASAVAESIWPAALKTLGATTVHPKEPRTIHLFRKYDEAAAAAANLIGEKFTLDSVHVDAASKTAFVVLMPELPNATFAVHGLLPCMRRAVAIAAADLLAVETFPNTAASPLWLRRGQAAWIADQTLGKADPGIACEKDPGVAAMIDLLLRRGKAGNFPKAAAIFQDQMTGETGPFRLAAAVTLYQALVQKYGQKIEAVLAKARKLEAGDDLAKRIFALVIAAVKIETIDTDYKNAVTGTAIPWRDVTPSLSPQKNGLLQCASVAQNAIAFAGKPVTKPNYVISGEATIDAQTEHQLNVLCGGSDALGFVSIGMNAESDVTVFTWGAAKDEWTEIASNSTTAIRAAKKFAFEISVTADVISIKIDGEHILDADLKGRVMTGAWGLGAASGSAGLWENVKVKE